MSEPRKQPPPPAPTPSDPPAPEPAGLADLFGGDDDWGLRDIAMTSFRNVMKGDDQPEPENRAGK